jgi:hypothetical protein
MFHVKRPETPTGPADATTRPTRASADSTVDPMFHVKLPGDPDTTDPAGGLKPRFINYRRRA